MKMYLHHCRVTSTTDETTVIVNALGDILFWVIERSPTYVCTCTLDNAKKVYFAVPVHGYCENSS